MSLFKIKEWWSAESGESVEVHYSPNSLCVGNIDNSSEKYDKIAVGSLTGMLRIYKPGAVSQQTENFSPYRPSDLVLEVQLKDPILQIMFGAFISGNTPRGNQLAILHPRRLVVATLTSAKGAVDHGYQFQLSPLYEHVLERSAFNMCCGPFGGAKAKDHIAVQSVDCTLTIFEHEHILFSRFLPNSLLPGPLKYWPVSNSFITVSSSWMLESYRFETLAVATDAKTKEESQSIQTSKRITADWVLNIGEPAIELRTTPLYTGAPCARAMVLGERNLFCVSDVGELVFSVKLDYSPLALFVTKSSRDSVSCIVVNNFNSLMFYENEFLRWSAHAAYTPTSVAVANLKLLQGAIVLLAPNGQLSLGYLGTDPTLFSVAPPASGRDIKWDEYDKEMKKLDEKIRESSKPLGYSLSKASAAEEEVSIKVSLSLENIARQSSKAIKIPGQMVLAMRRGEADDVRSHILAQAPISVDPVSTKIGRLDQTSAATVKFTLTVDASMQASNLSVKLAASYSFNGAPRFVVTQVDLPARVVAKPSTVEGAKAAADPKAVCKVTVESNMAPVPIAELFSEFAIDPASAPESVTATMAGSTVSVLAAKNSNRYRVQGPSLGVCSIFLGELTSRLAQRRGQVLSFGDTFPLEGLHGPIRQHLQARAELATAEARLAAACSQIIAVEKRLLSRVRDKTPALLDDMHVLLSSCQAEVNAAAAAVDAAGQAEAAAAAALAAAVRAVCLLVKLWRQLSDDEYAVLMAALQPDGVAGGGMAHGWEELADASIVYLLRSVLAAGRDSGRDAVFNPAPLAQPTDHGDGLVKHVKMLLDRLAHGARLVGVEPADASASLKLASRNPLQSLFDESSAASELSVSAVPLPPEPEAKTTTVRPAKKKQLKKSKPSQAAEAEPAPNLKSLPPSTGPLSFGADTTLPDLDSLPSLAQPSLNARSVRQPPAAKAVPDDSIPDLDDL